MYRASCCPDPTLIGLPRDDVTGIAYPLVGFDELGNPLGLHPQLGDLPLHPEEDDWYSVLGSWNSTTDNIETADGVGEINPENNIVTSITATNPPGNARAGPPRVFCQYYKCSGASDRKTDNLTNRCHGLSGSSQSGFHYYVMKEVIGKQITGVPITYPYTLVLYHSCSGPHTCAPGRFTCEAPNCSWRGSFKTKQAFNRQYLAKHHSDRVDCPVEGCPHVGDSGIKRADNLPAHLLNKHGIPRARPPYEN